MRSEDAAAFGVVYDRHAEPVLRFFLRRTACPHTAADLTAETFAEALRYRDRYRPDRGELRSWLFGIAANQLRRYVRRGSVDQRALRRIGVPMEWTDDELARVEALLDLAELRTQVAAHLAELSPALRDAVELRIVAGLPYRDVADRLGCSEGAARVRVSRALDALADVELSAAWASATAPSWGSS